MVWHIVVKDMFRVWLCAQLYKRMENRWGYLLVCACLQSFKGAIPHATVDVNFHEYSDH